MIIRQSSFLTHRTNFFSSLRLSFPFYRESLLPIIHCESWKLMQNSISHSSMHVEAAIPTESWESEGFSPIIASSKEEEETTEEKSTTTSILGFQHIGKEGTLLESSLPPLEWFQKGDAKGRTTVEAPFSNLVQNKEIQFGLNIKGRKLTARSKRHAIRRHVARERLEESVELTSQRSFSKDFKSQFLFNNNSFNSFNSILLYNDLDEMPLLTAEEEVQLTLGIQDLRSIELLKATLEKTNGKSLTLAEWAKSLKMEEGAFLKRLMYGKNCKDMMIHRNVGLVISVAKKYQDKGVSMEDLIQAGCEGLIRGCYKFDPARGFRLSTYVYWWIRQGICSILGANSRTIRLPAHIIEGITRMNSTRAALKKKYCRRVKDAEIAEELGIDVERIRMLKIWSRRCRSTETWYTQELLEKNLALGADIFTTVKQLRCDIEETLLTLNPRERTIIVLRYGLRDGRPRTFTEIGEILFLSKERIRQLEERAMTKLRQPEVNIGLRSYLKFISLDDKFFS